jgi:hypothetical protein
MAKNPSFNGECDLQGLTTFYPGDCGFSVTQCRISESLLFTAKRLRGLGGERNTLQNIIQIRRKNPHQSLTVHRGGIQRRETPFKSEELPGSVSKVQAQIP